MPNNQILRQAAHNDIAVNVSDPNKDLGPSQKLTIVAFLKAFKSIKTPQQKSISIIERCLSDLSVEGVLNDDKQVINILLDAIQEILTEKIEELNSNNKMSGVFQVKELIESMKTMHEYEEILSIGLDGYRDHFLHQFWVYLIGTLIIEKNYRAISKIIYKEMFDEKIKIVSKKTTGPVIEASWALIALFHDQAYLVEKIDKIADNIYGRLMPYTKDLDESGKLETFYSNDKSNLLAMILCSERGEASFDQIVYKLTGKKSGKCVNDLKRVFKKQLNEKEHKHSHALLSALYMKHILETNLVDVNGLTDQSLFIDTISAAIAMHHIQPKEIKYVTCSSNKTLNNHFFHCLLKICDHMQEWNREDREDKLKYNITLKELYIKKKGRSLFININWGDDFDESIADADKLYMKEYFAKYKRDIKFTLKYNVFHLNKNKEESEHTINFFS